MKITFAALGDEHVGSRVSWTLPDDAMHEGGVTSGVLLSVRHVPSHLFPRGVAAVRLRRDDGVERLFYPAAHWPVDVA